MLGIHKATTVASSLFEIGALSGSAMQLHDRDYTGALAVAFVGCMCVVMIAGTVILAEVAKVKARLYLRRQELEALKTPNPERPDA